jgi:EmrB/QacA subfamily drug resistance transporter
MVATALVAATFMVANDCEAKTEIYDQIYRRFCIPSKGVNFMPNEANAAAVVALDQPAPERKPLTLPNGKAVNPWLVLISIIFGFFMSLLDTTVTNLALDNIQTNLNTNLTAVSWVINAYNLTFAVLLVTAGRFADQFGRKLLLMLGMATFTIGSILCALAPSIELLIGARVIQAAGGAALTAVSLAIILAVFPPAKHGAAIGIWGALAGLAAAVGPILGGVLLDAGRGNLEWRWIFFINLPFCLVGLFLIARNVPELRDIGATSKIDLPGLVTVTGGMFCLALALIQGNEWGWTAPATLGLFAATIVLLIAFYFIETRQAQPILDFGLFKIGSFSAANLVMLLFSTAVQGAFLLLPLYFIIAQEQTPLSAAYSFIPMPLASFIVSALASKFSDKLNPRYMAIAGVSIVGLGLFSFSTITPGATYFDTLWRSALTGVGLAFCFLSLPNIALSQVPVNKLGVGSGALNTFRQLGYVLGVAILISIFTAQIQPNIADAKARAIEIVRTDTTVPNEARNFIITELEKVTPGVARESGTQSGGNELGEYTNTPLGQRISAEFNKATVATCSTVWLVAALIAWLAVIPAFMTKAPGREFHAVD